ncbi:MAG: cellulase family glycosylhydrolase [Lachnospiraceae bacterium]|nr:cellulase family glycosylhydrolase [Lachnospiraceae bacterium]
MNRRGKIRKLALLMLETVLLSVIVAFVGIRSVSGSENAVTVSVKQVNSWTEGNSEFVQYSVKLTGAKKNSVEKWRVRVNMNQAATVTNSWCGTFKRSGKVITVTPADYNKKIGYKETVEFGMILKGTGKPSCDSVEVTTWDGNGKSAVLTKDYRKKATPTPTRKPTPTKKPTPTPTRKPSPTKKPTPTPTRKPGSGTPLSQNGRLKVKGAKLVNEKGGEVVLKGVSTHGIAWFPQYVNKSAFQTLRDKWGVQCVRLAMYTAEYNGYCAGGDKAALKKKVQDGVKIATDLGMYIIIDWHILSDGNPQTYQNEAVAFFKEMSAKYKNQKNVIYEICNEPNGGTSWSQIKSYAQTVIKTIRANDKNAVILVGTPTWSQDVDIAAKSPIKGYSNLMYTFHFYAGTHQESYRLRVQDALDAGLPVFVSEFGITDASGNGSVNKTEGNKWITFLKKNKLSYVCWNLSNKNESSALLLPSCTKTGGFEDKDLSSQGKWFKAL